jgi:hypothetical protein
MLEKKTAKTPTEEGAQTIRGAMNRPARIYSEIEQIITFLWIGGISKRI